MHFDPIVFFLSAQTLLWLAVLLELAVCGIVCFPTSRIVRHYALALLGSLFVSYQLGLWLGNFPHPCLCLGGSLEWLGISSGAMRIIAFLLLLYIWLPSCAVLAPWLWKRKQRNASFGKGKTPSNVLLLLAVALSAALPNSQAAETFQLEGKLILTGFDYSDPEKIIHSQTNLFSVTLQRQDYWQVCYESPQSFPDGYYTAGSDGENLYSIMYSLVHWEPPNLEQLRKLTGNESEIMELPIAQKFKSVDDNVHLASITSGQYPYDIVLENDIRMVWFALSSEHYLNASTNVSRMPAFWLNARQEPLAFTFENEVETFPQWPRLPKKAKFKTLGRDSLPKDPATMPEIDYPEDRGAKRMLKEKLFLLDYLQAGHVSMEYTCLAQTNIGVSVLPLEFEFRSRWHAHGVSYFKTNQLAGLWIGQVTNIVRLTNKPPLGKLPIRGQGLGIHDYRFRNRAEGGKVNYLSYTTTNNVWPAKNSAFVQEHYEWHKMKQQEAEWNSLGRFAGLVLMLLVLLTPVMHWRNKKREAKP